MTCFFGNINNFSQQLTVQGRLIPSHATYYNETDCERGHPSIACYSLTTRQKGAAITLCALAIIILLVGAASLGGANIIGTKGGWAMLGTGSGTALLVIGFMTVNHLLFIKRVSQFLGTQSPDLNEWNAAKHYPEDEGEYRWLDDTDAKNKFSFQVGENTFYGKRYTHTLYYGHTIDLKFHIEFHRTLSIHEERR